MFQRLLKALGVPDGPGVVHAPAPARATPSLAHEALLVCIDPVTGKLWEHTRHIWDSALLIELAHEGRLEVTGFGKGTRQTVLDTSPLGDPILDKAVIRLETLRPGRKTMGQLMFLPRHEDLVERLVAQELLIEEQHKTLGIFKRRRLHPTAAAGRDELVARLRGVLLGEETQDERTALLLAALDVGMPPRFLVPRDRVKEADRRTKEIVAGIGEAERALISAVQAARDRADSGGDAGGGD